MKLLSVIGGAISLNVFQAKLLQKGGQTGSEQVPLASLKCCVSNDRNSNIGAIFFV